MKTVAATEQAINLSGRTIDLLEAPLVVAGDKGQLTIPRLRIVLGTFDTASMRQFAETNRERLVREVAERLQRADAAQLATGAGQAYLKTVVAGVLARGMGTRPDEDFPSTYFESPGRHGVIGVELPEGYIFTPTPVS